MSFAVTIKRCTIIMSYKHRLADIGSPKDAGVAPLFYSVYNERADVSF